MENIHILTTLNPSRMLRGFDGIRLFKNEVSPDNQWCVNVNIHITNDEEIKDGDKRINNYQMKPKGEEIPSKKIILTTDQDLIKDGVQAIPDEFLEWFVKNPSCEEVEVESEKRHWKEVNWMIVYKIIIPKEEPKQETIEEVAERYSANELSQLGFINGAKWQQEQDKNKYSEKEMLEMLHKFGFDYTYNYKEEKTIYEWIPEWFEEYKRLNQFKNK
jgi:hypothetical protein